MKKSIAFSTFVILSLFTFQLRAQLVPRTVLLEEGTNWSCGPCASMNPGVEAFLHQHEGNVIHLAYHPNWPGADDPMYLNDKTDNQYRVATYYAISGVPSVAVDGSAPFVPGSQQEVESAYDARMGVGSPLAITVTREVNGTTVTVHVTLHPVQDLSSRTKLALRVAAAEEFVAGPGPNGEAQYIHPLRAMMPSYTGTKVHLSTGDTSFTFTYPLKTSYNASNMYEVAFVQDDASKEVLQAATDEQNFSLSPNPGESWVQRVSSQTSINFNLNNAFTSLRTFSVSYLPTSANVWPVTITAGTGSNGSFVVNAGASLPISVSVTQGAGTYSSGILQVTSTSGSETLVSSFPLKFISPDVKIAYVDIGNDSVRSANTVATLDALNFQWVPLSGGEAAAMNAWTATEFPEMVVAGNKWILTGEDKAGVANYLASGGHLFLQGGEIAFGLADPLSTDQDVSFLNNVLKASYVKDSAGPTIVHGVSADAVSNDFSDEAINIYAEDVDQPNQPDEIKPSGGSIPIFYYGQGANQVAGIRWQSGAIRLVYLSFGLQNLAPQDRAGITTDVFNWFHSESGVNGSSAMSFSLEPNYPNPFSMETRISYSLVSSEPIRISVVDTRGTEVAVLVDGVEETGPHSVSFNAHGLAHGTYFCVLRSAEGSAIRAMTIE